jgi:hypothetical protein
VSTGLDLSDFFDSTTGKFKTGPAIEMVAALVARRDQRRLLASARGSSASSSSEGAAGFTTESALTIDSSDSDEAAEPDVAHLFRAVSPETGQSRDNDEAHLAKRQNTGL